MEFKTESQEKEINDNDRHVKLIKIAGIKVTIHVAVHWNTLWITQNYNFAHVVIHVFLLNRTFVTKNHIE